MNCICADSAATCSAVSSLNGWSTICEVWSCEKSGGACSPLACCHAAAPTLFCTWVRIWATLSGTTADGDADALGAVEPLGLALGLALALGDAEALADDEADALADDDAEAEVDGDALDDVSGRSVVVFSTVRKRN